MSKKTMIHAYIDIETIPGPVMPDPETIVPPANYKNPDTIKKFQEENVESAWRKEALVSVKGRVLVIGFAFNDGDVMSVQHNGNGKGEEEVLRAFWGHLEKELKNARGFEWVGFNLRPFDLNWLRHRAYKYGLHRLAQHIPFARYDKSVVDLREVWNGADYQGKGKLGEIARFLGLGSKTEGIDGSKVFDFWQAGKIDEVAAYCRDDVELTRAIHKRLFAA